MSDTKKRTSLSQALNSGVNKYGTSILANLAIALKTSSLYGFAHSNVTHALEELHGFMESFIKIEGDSELTRLDDFLFLNEVRVKVDLGAVATYQYVADVLKVRNIGGFSFKAGLGREELENFVGLLNEPPENPENAWAEFHEKFRAGSFPNFEVSQHVAATEIKQSFTNDKRLLASSTYFRAIQRLDEQLESVRTKGKANLKKLKRVIQSMVDLILSEQSTLLALVNIKDFGSFLANHSVNVTVLSIALGAKLGFSKKHLGDLGVAALLHDVGKCQLDESVYLANPKALEKQQLHELRDHVYSGVDILINQRISDAVVKSMNVAFLHHFRFDSTGYPRSQVVREQDLFSRIVAVADFYDNKTRSQKGEESWTPDRILRELLERGGTEFDPLVVKAFSNLMGLYPVGCIVSLDTGELGSVITPATNPRFLDRPTVKIFTDELGMPTEEVVDLMQRDASGGFPRSILKLFQQEEVQLEMAEFLSVI